MRIGLVLNILDEEYQISFYKGIKNRAMEYGIEVICLQLENTPFSADAFISRFPREDYFNVDGLILLTSVVSDNNEINLKKDIEKIWGQLPVVSIGQKIEGIPSFLVRTDESMSNLVQHLVEEHNYRNIIYITGAKNHYDAIIREQYFLQIIETYKNKYPDINYTIRNGGFTESSAIGVMQEYYSNSENPNPDAVICANDNMAIGVYKFFNMNSGNPRIKKCAVTGFDDISQGKYEIPALTTIHQPLEEMSLKALDTIKKMIDGEEVELVDYSDSKLILRESCGCKKRNNFQEEVSVVEMQANYVRSEQMLRMVTHLGQNLNYVETKSGLQFMVNQTMEQLDIQDFCVLSFENHISKFNDIKSDAVIPVFVKRNGKLLFEFSENRKSSMGDFYKDYLNYDKNVPKSLVLKFLYYGNEIIGCVFYDSNNYSLPYLCSISIIVAQTINRIAITEERKKYYQYLEQEVENRTKELVEANNRRMEVEAEVLRISEIERQRFSNDLHDDICQRLAGISMLCRSYSNQKNPIKKEEMVELAELISDTLQTTRQYAHNSYPVELENLGMNHSISNLCNSFEKQSGIKCEYIWDLDTDSYFDKTEKLNIFRIIQEALHNVLKHAKANKVVVSLVKEDDTVVVQIIDDGCGLNFDKQGDDKGLGLNSMQYRANQIDATFSIRKNEPTGTCIEVMLKGKKEE